MIQNGMNHVKYPIKKWSEVLTIISGKNQRAVECINGMYPIYGSGGIIGYANEYLCEAGTTVVGRKGTINSPIYVAERFWNVDTAFGIAPGSELNPKFLYYFCKHFNFKALDKSTTIPSLAKRDLLSIKMPVPSICEQEEIIARIEELFSQLDSAAATLNTIKQQLVVYRQSVLKEVFDSALGYDKGTIQSVCRNIVDCPHSTPKWTEGGKICLRTTNFKRGYLDLSEINYVSTETFDERNARLVPLPGDVLYSREGAILGIACIIPDNLFVCLGQRMMLLRTNEKMLGRFLMHYLNSPKVTSFVTTKTGGSASPHVNVGDIKAFVVPIPPITEQQKMLEQIESRLSVCDSIEKTTNTALQQAEVLRQSILKKAFEGRL